MRLRPGIILAMYTLILAGGCYAAGRDGALFIPVVFSGFVLFSVAAFILEHVYRRANDPNAAVAANLSGAPAETAVNFVRRYLDTIARREFDNAWDQISEDVDNLDLPFNVQQRFAELCDLQATLPAVLDVIDLPDAHEFYFESLRDAWNLCAAVKILFADGTERVVHLQWYEDDTFALVWNPYALTTPEYLTHPMHPALLLE